MINLNKKYKTRNGCEVELSINNIVSAQARASKIIGFVYEEEQWRKRFWRLDGKYEVSPRPHKLDLIEDVYDDIWVNIYECGDDIVHYSKQSAINGSYNNATHTAVHYKRVKE